MWKDVTAKKIIVKKSIANVYRRELLVTKIANALTVLIISVKIIIVKEKKLELNYKLDF